MTTDNKNVSKKLNQLADPSFYEDLKIHLSEYNPSGFELLSKKVIEWAKERQIIQNSSPETQLFKAFSEMGELADATIKKDIPGIEDAIGDVLVCLINYSEIMKLDIVECLEGAYNEIKDRKGTLLPNGCFVKE